MEETRKSEVILQTFLALLYLYLFLVGIKLLGVSLKGLGKGFAESLIQTTANPLVGLGFLSVLFLLRLFNRLRLPLPWWWVS
ncbi:MAG: hypothetical protein GXO71_01495 [Caldiserica bacterium]|nr:hypothetical protein [Caldisericota bacterium]